MKIKQIMTISIAFLFLLIGIVVSTCDLKASELNGESINYTVQENETLQDIANRYNVTINSLEDDNNLSSNSVLPGQELVINPIKKSTDTVKKNKKKKAPKVKKVAPKPKKKKISKFARANEKAKRWIAQRESGGKYNAKNGIYIGKYQLGFSMLKGNYSAKNQEKTADRYVKNRYGSWVNAKKHWLKFHWY